MDDTTWKRELGARIRQAREAAGYDTLRAFVETSEVADYNRYSRYERGVSEPRVRELAKIAETAGVSIDQLVLGAAKGERNDVFDEWLRTYPAHVSVEERLTLAGVRFVGLKPTPQAYTAMLAALRMCAPATTSGA